MLPGVPLTPSIESVVVTTVPLTLAVTLTVGVAWTMVKVSGLPAPAA